MARLGLGESWQCTFSNEWAEKKAAAYLAKFGGKELRVCDVADLTPGELPGIPDLVWASFPCQDLSLAGNGAGLSGERSGTFRPFWNLMTAMRRRNRHPKVVVLENVIGTLTSHGGRDFTSIIHALSSAGYQAGAMVMDAVRFLPHSRPRLFIVAVHADAPIPPRLLLPGPSAQWHTKSLCTAVGRLPKKLRDSWLWWDLPAPSNPIASFSDIIEDEPSGIAWNTQAQTNHILSLMSPLHLEKIEKAQRLRIRVVGTVYRRTRPDQNGVRLQRAEVRFDQISGCLRTPVGGSSRQTIIVVEGKKIRTRLLSPREAARLMGVPEDYPIPERYNDAYHLFGDGLAVPVVDWLNRHLLTPVIVGRNWAAA